MWKLIPDEKNAKNKSNRKEISSTKVCTDYGCCHISMLVLTGTPWNLVPTLVTEDVTVITVTDYGCVGESVLGRSVVVSDCNAKTGDVISATFYIPAIEINGYYDRVREKLAMVIHNLYLFLFTLNPNIFCWLPDYNLLKILFKINL